MSEKLLEVKSLNTSFYIHSGEVQAVRGISFTVNRGEAVGVVGESGSGKSVTAMSIMKLLPASGEIKSGEILFKNEDIVKKSNREMRPIRGNKIAMVFQDSMKALNPVYTIGNQIIEAIRIHQGLNKKEARKKAIDMLRLVGISSPENRIDNYPHEFSGGMRQRAMIAIALSCQPDLLIADEPTTALDVTIQAQILELIKSLRDKKNMLSIILITHDLGVVADICSRIIVMYGGLIMEEGTVEEIFYNPKHPYTVGLLKSIPRFDLDEEQRLTFIEGNPPDLINPYNGCPFTSRCLYTMKICMKYRPTYFQLTKNHRAMCWLLHDKAPRIDVDKGVSRGRI